MKYNLVGIVIRKRPGDFIDVESLLQSKLVYIRDVNFEEVVNSSENEGPVDVLQTDHGILVIVGLDYMYDLSNLTNESIQFIIAEIADIYYFERYFNGELKSQYIASRESVVTYNMRKQTISDLIGSVWEYTGKCLQIKFREKMLEVKFSRYQRV